MVSKLKLHAQTHTTLADVPSFDPLINTRRTFAAEALGLHRQSPPSMRAKVLNSSIDILNKVYMRIFSVGLRLMGGVIFAHLSVERDGM